SRDAVSRGIRSLEYGQCDRRQRVLRFRPERARTPGHRVCPERHQRHPRGVLMPSATPQAVRKQLAQGKPDPVYVIVGDDEAEMSRLAGEVSALVEDELRAFNLERMYATGRSGTATAIAQAPRT